MTIPSMHAACDLPRKSAPLGRLSLQPSRMATPIVMGVALLMSASAIAQEGHSSYAPPPLFSGQGHQQLTAAGVMPPASAPGATAASPSLDPAIQALVEGKTPEAAAQLSLSSSTPPVPATAATSAAREDMPWTLRGENRPWSLHFTPSNPLGTLYLSPPNARDARIMLPGVLADSANRARFTVNKFVTDSIGISSQARARQMEALSRWIENTNKQLERVRDDEWEHYQFNVESRREIDAFRAKVEAQAAPDLAFIQAEIVRAVAEVTPLMESMSSYEMQMAWYNVMVQMKDGFALYQSQVQRADQQLLGAIDSYIELNPFVARPTTPPPRQGVDGFSGPTAIRAATPAPTVTPSIVGPSPTERTPAEPATTSTANQPSSVVPGLAVGGLFLLAVAWLVLKVRGARRGKGAPVPEKS